MKVKNTYHKRFSVEFDELGGFSIGPQEEKIVSDILGKRLILNNWIKEIKEKLVSKEEKIDPIVVEKVVKKRRKKIKTI